MVTFPNLHHCPPALCDKEFPAPYLPFSALSVLSSSGQLTIVKLAWRSGKHISQEQNRYSPLVLGRMHRQLSYFSGAKSFLPSPAPDELSDSEADLIPLLEEKRREIDMEIEAFRSRKEEEFKSFEHELRSRKKRNNHTVFPHPATSISGLSNLSKKELATNGLASKERKKKAEDAGVCALMPTGPSRPSVSVDRVTINGLTTPPVSGTPPLGKNYFPSPTLLSGTPPRNPSKRETGKSPTPPDKENEFHGLFTPGYLQLLDTRPSSLPQTATPPPISETKRAVTAPTLPSTSLPSALRAASGAARKRKHVTFRLSHSVVVEPSSSYEETPSPSEDQYDRNLDDAGAGSGIEIMPDPSPIEIPQSYLSEDVTSPDKPDNEAGFFSFDEELDEKGDELSDDANDLENDEIELDESGKQPESPKFESPTFSSGSLPINIVNPSSSLRAALSS
ncbi:hypothetical protein GJ744_009544 [Endocarpon pusillum]|uniref:Uncharacterized protein n=1 Tax=Endocarpon pusillum TaxID=364733 RepID=A0A8H7AFQ6_9EURO|nr:hypothetical protein GJ744_009544 [Endocarpon pusillum]